MRRARPLLRCACNRFRWFATYRARSHPPGGPHYVTFPWTFLHGALIVLGVGTKERETQSFPSPKGPDPRSSGVGLVRNPRLLKRRLSHTAVASRLAAEQAQVLGRSDVLLPYVLARPKCRAAQVAVQLVTHRFDEGSLALVSASELAWMSLRTRSGAGSCAAAFSCVGPSWAPSGPWHQSVVARDRTFFPRSRGALATSPRRRGVPGAQQRRQEEYQHPCGTCKRVYEA